MLSCKSMYIIFYTNIIIVYINTWYQEWGHIHLYLKVNTFLKVFVFTFMN